MTQIKESWLGAGLEWLDLYDREQVAEPSAEAGAAITFLDVAEVLALHEVALGTQELPRNAAALAPALDSALARARNAMTYDHATAEQAGWLLAEGIVKNHPFTNGNKRTALLALVAFWEKNNVPVPHDAVWLARKILELAKR